jgi:chromosome segregation ATPase
LFTLNFDLLEELNSELKNIKSELEEVASQKASLETENNQNLTQCQALQTELSSFKDGASGTEQEIAQVKVQCER